MSSESRRGARIIIEGVDEDGAVFRPSDWPERLAALLASFGTDHRLHYSDAARPGVGDSGRCLVVDDALQARDPDAFAFILKFARDNRLQVHADGGPAVTAKARDSADEPAL